jgi:hypothetical protein
VSLLKRGFGITLAGMFKSDHFSVIMLFVNASVPLVFLLAAVALIVRNIALA